MKNQRTKLLSILVGVVVVTGALSLSYCEGPSAASPGASDRTTTAESLHAASDRVEGASVDEVVDNRSQRRAVNVQIADAQAKRAPEADDAVGEREIVVVVIDGQTRLPVPSAEVAYMTKAIDWSDLSEDERLQLRNFGVDTFAQYRALGRVARADTEGRVRLPLGEVLRLACVDEGRAGEKHVDVRDFDWSREQELVLWPDFSCRVRVVDQAGEPVVGIPVEVRPAGSLGFVAYANVPTGADGIAELPNMRSWARAMAEFFHHGEEPPADVGLRLAVRGLGADATQVLQLSLLEPPEGILEFVAPPTGEVVVAMRDSWGQPCGDYSDVSLGGATGAFSIRGETVGVARFLWVALGQRFEASAMQAPVNLASAYFDGPVAPGQVVHVVMQAEDAGGGLLTGLLVDENQDLVEGEITLQFRTESFRGPRSLKTGPDGRFRFEVAADMVGQKFHHAILVDKDRGLACELPMGQPIGRERHDFGRLVMRPIPLLVAGSVRVDRQPARVDLRLEHLPDGAPEGRWARHRGHVVEWLEPGKFCVRAVARSGSYRLSASNRDTLPLQPVPIEVGHRYVELDLVSGGSMRAVVLVDDEELLEELICMLIPHRPTPDRVAALRARGRMPAGELTKASQAAQRHFLWHGIVAGSYRLEVRCGGQPDPVAVLDELIVEAGGSCEDSRLESIDLRGQLQRIKLTLLDEGGRPIEASATIFSGDGAQLFGTRKYHRRSAIDVVGRAPMSFSIAARGFEIAHLKGVREDRSVQLRRLSRVQVVLPEVALPPGMQLRFDACRQLDFGAGQSVWVNTSFGPREFSMSRMLRSQRQVPWGGDSRVVQVSAGIGESVALSVWLRGLWRQVPVELVSPGQVVCDPTRPSPVKVRITAEALREALAQVGS